MQTALDIIKKNMLSIICGVIALLAIIAVFFYPLPGMFEEQQAQLEQRKTELDSLRALADKARLFPQTEPGDGERAKLDVFPTQGVIERAQGLLTAISTEAQQVEALAAKINEHQLLVKDSLPNPRSTSFEYREQYQKMLDFENANEAIRQQTLPYRVLNAGTPPTPEEVKAESERRAADITERRLVPGMNDEQVAAEIAAMQSTIDEDMKVEVARSKKIYISDGAMDIYGGVIGSAATGTDLPAATVYLSQLGLWVQQDVCAALAEANAKAQGIIDAPVKHLVKIEVNEDSARGQAPADSGDGGMPAPRSATARTSGPIYEVIHFTLTIYVDATQVPQVLTDLSRNRFITVLRTDLSAVDTASAALNGYIYGPKPVVQLTLDCEALFMKSWLSKFIPPSISAAPQEGF